MSTRKRNKLTHTIAPLTNTSKASLSKVHHPSLCPTRSTQPHDTTYLFTHIHVHTTDGSEFVDKPYAGSTIVRCLER